MISNLFELRLTLAQIAIFAHSAEVQSPTGLGREISQGSGSGAVGLITELGSYYLGSVDSILVEE